MNKFLITIATAIVVMLSSTFAKAEALTMNQVREAACKIKAASNSDWLGNQSYSMGTGMVVNQDDHRYYIMTNAHVVANKGQHVDLTFFHKGYKSTPVPGNVELRYYVPDRGIDLAIVSTERKYFKAFTPRVIPIAPMGVKVKVNDYLQAAGCPQGGFLQSWEGRLISDDGVKTVFNMLPIPGQSGSNVLGNFVQPDGSVETQVASLLAWRDDRNGVGIGLSIDLIHQVLAGAARDAGFQVPSYYTPIASVQNADGKWKPVNKGKCGCGATKEQHEWVEVPIRTQGQYTRVTIAPSGREVIEELRCPRCEHGRFMKDNGCPGGRCFPWRYKYQGPPQKPQPKPYVQPQPENNPGTINPGDLIGGESVPGSTIADIEKQKAELLKKLDDLQTQKDKAVKDAEKSAEETIRNVEELARSEVEKANNEAELQTKIAEEVNEENKSLKDKIAEKVLEITGLDNKITDLKGQVEDLNEKGNHYLDEIAPGEGNGSILERFGLTGIGVALGAWLWNIFGIPFLGRAVGTGLKGRMLKRLIERVGKKKLRKILLNNKKKVDEIDDSVYNVIDTDEEKVDEEQEVSINEDDPKQDATLPPPSPPQERPWYVFSTEEPRLTTPIVPHVEKVEAAPPVVNVTVEPQQTEQPVQVDSKPQTTSSATAPVTINNNYYGSVAEIQRQNEEAIKIAKEHAPNDYFKEWALQKEADGEDIKQYILYHELYADAVRLMKKGQLFVRPGLPVQGQRKTADMIQNWVRSKFLEVWSHHKFQVTEEIYKSAYIGYLYIEAMNELRSGTFVTLSAEDTANAIQAWVDQQLMHKLGIKI